MTTVDLSQFDGMTPGPWRYSKENGSPTTGQRMIAGAKPGYLAEVRDCGSGIVEANARAIASVPDLIAEVRELRATLDQVARHLSAVGYPVDSHGNYAKDGAWTFAKACPHEPDAIEVASAFEIARAALAGGAP